MCFHGSTWSPVLLIPLTMRKPRERMRAQSFQPCPTFCIPTDCSPPGSSVHGIPQARILEWVAMPFSRGSSWSRIQTPHACIVGRFFTTEPPGKSRENHIFVQKEGRDTWSEPEPNAELRPIPADLGSEAESSQLTQEPRFLAVNNWDVEVGY